MSFPGRIYFISEHSNQELVHGGIGPVDIETILIRNNAIPIRFPYHFDFSLKAKMVRLGYLFKIGFTIKPRSVIIFQHPLYARMNELLLKVLRLRRSITVICIVADIDGLKDGNREVLQKETRFFRKYKYFIVHNENMDNWLRSFYPLATCTFLTCFDFLTKNNHHARSLSNTIVFAGNLQKSRFLEKLHLWLEKNPSLHVNLYGPHITDAMLANKKVNYKGLYHPYSLPDLIEGSFGLIWDGEGLEQPSGSLGNYMQFISHHKLSLYIVSNLPVIAHEKAGSAELIKKFNIGFTVNSLFEIEDKISRLSEREYERMVQNTYDLAKEITSGNGLQKALSELLNRQKNETL
jgi:hypothetical protein